MNKHRRNELIKQINSYLPSIEFLIELLNELGETEYAKKLNKVYNKLMDKFQYLEKDSENTEELQETQENEYEL